VYESPTSRWFLRLGALTLVAGLVAGVFELMATQAPYTPLHFGVLAAPFAQLRASGLWLSLFAFVAAGLRPRLGEREPWILFGLYALGTLMSLSAMAWAAAQGMMAIQVFDPRPGAGWIAITRLAGQGLILLAAVDACRRLLRPATPASFVEQERDDAHAAEEDQHEEPDGEAD